MKPKKVLITGVAGMIGSHLLDKLMLDTNYQVIGIDNLKIGSLNNIKRWIDHDRFRFYKLDILDLESLKIIGRDIDTIVHLAAEKKIGESQESSLTLEVNTQGTKNIFDVAKMWNSKVVFASTSDVYGMSTDLPLREDGDLLLGPSMIKRWSYAVSKLYGEQLAFAYYYDFKVPIVVLRYFGAFSPRSSFAWSGGHVPIFINASIKNQDLIIHGDGKQTRSMGFVEDIVDGTFLAMHSEKAVGQIINIGNDEEMSVIDTAILIHDLVWKNGSAPKLKFIPMEELFGKYKDIMRRIPDLTKAKELLGFHPKFKLKDAIQATIDEIKCSN
jgi:UDP-glucose 4-epimerase